MSVTTFQLHRSSMVLIGLLAALVCGLWFTAGLSVGIAWQIAGRDDPAGPTTVEPAFPDAPEPPRRLEPGATAATTIDPGEPRLRRPPSDARPRLPAADPPIVQVDAPSVPPPTTRSAVRAAPLPAELKGPSPSGTTTPPPSPTPDPSPDAAPVVTPRPEAPTTALASPSSPTTAPAPTPAQPAGTASGFAVQLGAFLHDENTQELVQDLQKRGLAPFVVRTPTARQQTLQSVRIGPYASKREALDTVQRLRSRQGLDSFIVRVDPRID